jgi:hypothetical protein
MGEKKGGREMSYWQIANAAASFFAASVLTVVVLHPRIHEGLLIKAGLMMMVFGLLATAALTASSSIAWDAYWRAGFAMRIGLAFVCVGILYRANVSAKKAPAYDAQEALTKSWIFRITEPARDLAHLLADEPVKTPATPERLRK